MTVLIFFFCIRYILAKNVGNVHTFLEKYEVRRCFYGHLHGPSHKLAMEGLWDGVEYRLVSADFLDFKPFTVIL